MFTNKTAQCRSILGSHIYDHMPAPTNAHPRLWSRRRRCRALSSDRFINGLHRTAAVDALESIDSHFIPALRQHIHAVTLEPPTVCGNELWPYTCGISLPLVHSAGAPTTIRATGHVIRHSAASRDAILEALDTRFLPLVRRQLRAAVEGVQVFEF